MGRRSSRTRANGKAPARAGAPPLPFTVFLLGANAATATPCQTEAGETKCQHARRRGLGHLDLLDLSGHGIETQLTRMAGAGRRCGPRQRGQFQASERRHGEAGGQRDLPAP